MMYNNLYSNYPGGFGLFGLGGATIGLFVLWTIVIKGFALWHAGRRNEKWWFIALLIINTGGILELVYLIFFAKVLLKDSAFTNSVTSAVKGNSSSQASSTGANTSSGDAQTNSPTDHSHTDHSHAHHSHPHAAPTSTSETPKSSDGSSTPQV